MPKPQPKKTRITLRVDLGGTNPPNEFRVFKRGANPTTKGEFVFDDAAARAVMSAYRQHGVDVMIDLEHLSLDDKAPNYDPNAYGWCKLELRSGELWAVGVSWTEAGAAKLRKREQRYISPAFHFLEDSGQITEIYNIAICAVPATYETPALVAASKRVGKNIGTLTIEVKDMNELQKCAAALGLKDDATLEDVLNAIKALQDSDGGGSEEEEEAADDPKDDNEDEEEEEKMAAAIKDLPPKMQARFLAGMTATAANKALQARLAKLEAAQSNSAVEALIAANASKLPKGLEKWARKQSVETLTEYFSTAPAVERERAKPPKQVAKSGKETEAEDGEEVTLTKRDKEVAKLTGRTHAQMLEFKKKRLEKDKAKREERGGADDEDQDEAVA